MSAYTDYHTIVKLMNGKANSCVWECKSDAYEWANLTGDYKNPKDYIGMCIACHRKYDAAIRTTLGIKCIVDHFLPGQPKQISINSSLMPDLRMIMGTIQSANGEITVSWNHVFAYLIELFKEDEQTIRGNS